MSDPTTPTAAPAPAPANVQRALCMIDAGVPIALACRIHGVDPEAWKDAIAAVRDWRDARVAIRLFSRFESMTDAQAYRAFDAWQGMVRKLDGSSGILREYTLRDLIIDDPEVLAALIRGEAQRTQSPHDGAYGAAGVGESLHDSDSLSDEEIEIT